MRRIRIGQREGNALRVALVAGLLVASAGWSSVSAAQTAAARQLSTTVGGVFSFSPAVPTLTQNSQSGNLCSPGACYVGNITTTANRGWKLQVKLSSTPTGFTVAFVQTTVPPSAQAVNSGTRTVLNTTTWLTIAQGTTPTAGSAIGMMFNANKVGGPNGFMPNGAQVAAVVQYQVIANP